MQFHFSWVLLPPFLLAAWILRRRAGWMEWGKTLPGFLAGSALPLAFLVPTLLRFGFSQGAGGMKLTVGFNPQNFLAFFTVLGRFYSLPTFELLRFLQIDDPTGAAHPAHWAYLKTSPWIFLPGVFLILTGWLQALALFIGGWLPDSRHPDAGRVQRWTFLAFLGVWMSFWFSTKPPSAHIYYVLLPLTAIYSFYAGSRLLPRRRWNILALICFIANLWFQTGYALQAYPFQSLYRDRTKILRAIDQKDYRILGERRPGSHN